MNILLENKKIQEMVCGEDVSYILEENTMLSTTEYKVLQNQVKSCFIKCMRILQNGKIQLYYLTESYRPLASMLPTLDPKNFVTIVSNLLFNIANVKNNGFLTCQNIDASLDRIYIESTTGKVKLIYLPITEKIYDNQLSFENEVRTNLVKIITSFPQLSTPQIMNLATNLSSGDLTIEDVYNTIKGSNLPVPPIGSQENLNIHENRNLRIVAMNAPARAEILINKDEFVIGKKAELCDAAITFNKMISRKHCKIIKIEKTYYISDLQSANGTFLNGVRLQPGQKYPIKNRDIIRMANSDFQVCSQ